MGKDTKGRVTGRFRSQEFGVLSRRLITALCLLAITGFLVVGCGGQSDPPSQPKGDDKPTTTNNQTGNGSSTTTPTEVQTPKDPAKATVNGNVQYVTSSVSKFEYEPILVQEGIPVKWTLTATSEELNLCNNSIVIPEYGIKLDLKPGDNIIEFTPEKAGTYFFSCWMEMIYSYIAVADEKGEVPPVDWGSLPKEVSGACCG